MGESGDSGEEEEEVVADVGADVGGGGSVVGRCVGETVCVG